MEDKDRENQRYKIKKSLKSSIIIYAIVCGRVEFPPLKVPVAEIIDDSSSNGSSGSPNSCCNFRSFSIVPC